MGCNSSKDGSAPNPAAKAGKAPAERGIEENADNQGGQVVINEETENGDVRKDTPVAEEDNAGEGEAKTEDAAEGAQEDSAPPAEEGGEQSAEQTEQTQEE